MGQPSYIVVFNVLTQTKHIVIGQTHIKMIDSMVYLEQRNLLLTTGRDFFIYVYKIINEHLIQDVVDNGHTCSGLDVECDSESEIERRP